MPRFVPTFLADELRLIQARRRFPHADYIRSPRVAESAVLGRGVGIGEHVVINPGVTLGDHTYVNRGAIVFSGEVGKFCSIAHYSQVGAEQHPVRHLSTSPFMYGPRSVTGSPSGFDEFPAPPTIGSDVWIGSNAVVMQGVTIGHGAIVAAGAVVTKDVSPYSIVAGVPAKQIGERFSAPVVADLLEWRWWDLDDDELSKLGPMVAAGERWATIVRDRVGSGRQ